VDIEFVAPDLRRLDKLKREAFVAACFTEDRPFVGALGLADWRLAGQLSRLRAQGHFEGHRGERLLVATRPRLSMDKLFLLGLGERAGFDVARFREATTAMLTMLDRARVRASVFDLPGRSVLGPEEAMEAFLAVAQGHPEQDAVTLVETPDEQRAMAPVLERERRRQQALELVI
jgi:leucyl aminopeptidase